jgi:tetratricopeptide (TPR) repeat protein
MHAEGRLAEAESYYLELLRARPDSIEALEGLGVLLIQLGRLDEATSMFARGVATHPESARLHAKLGAAYRNLRRFDEAHAHLQTAIELDPALPEPWNSLGRLAFDQRRYADAEAAYRTTIRLQPQFVVAYKNLCSTLLALRRWSDAVQVLRAYLRVEPNDHEALSDLGQALGEQGDPDLLDEAEAACRRALELAPGFADGLDNLGNVLRVRGRLDEAVACYQRALLGDPRRTSSCRLMGHVLQHCGRFDEAAQMYESARALQPNDPKVHADLGSLAATRGNYDESARHYQLAIRFDPNYVEGHQGLGQALLQQGRLDEAEACFREALRIDRTLAASWVALARLQSERGDIDLACQSARAALSHQPRNADAYWRLAITLKGRLADAEVQAMQRLLEENKLPDRARALLHFGLAGVFDARGWYEQAAAHLENANALQAALKATWGLRHDPDEHARFIGRMIASFTPEYIGRTRRWGNPDPRPVFVVGLPRTGTSLVEQILASHPKVHGAGELGDVLRIFEVLPSLVGQPWIDPFRALKLLRPESASAAAKQYLDRLNTLATPTAARVIDKMPDNIQLIGLIAVLWPGSRVIFCSRDVRDIAVSCWFTGFETNPWTNTWELMARWFADHQRVLEHWRRTQPVKWLEVGYESLVADLEGHARRMVDFLELDWDPACVEFYKTRRDVRTASLVQVRQPINSHSVGRWKNYVSNVQPLLKALQRYGVTLTHGA